MEDAIDPLDDRERRMLGRFVALAWRLADFEPPEMLLFRSSAPVITRRSLTTHSRRSPHALELQPAQ
jgi:hypothetical protein